MNQDFNLLDIFKSINKWKNHIVIATIGAGILAVVVSLTMDDIFQSKAIFYPSNPELTNRQALFTDDSDATLFGTDDDVDRMLSLANSTELHEDLIAEFNLMEHYEIDSTAKYPNYKTMLEFRENFTVVTNAQGAIEVEFLDIEPELTQKLVSKAVEKIDYLAQTMLKDKKQNILSIYKNQFESRTAELDSINTLISKARAELGIYDPIIQIKQMGRKYSNAIENIELDKIKLKVKEKYAGSRDTSVVNLRARIKGYETIITEFQVKDSLGMTKLDRINKNGDYVDQLITQQESLIFELSNLKITYKQYEISANSNVSSIYMVEKPRVPERKIKPKRSIIVLGTMFIVFVLSMITILVLDRFPSLSGNAK